MSEASAELAFAPLPVSVSSIPAAPIYRHADVPGPAPVLAEHLDIAQVREMSQDFSQVDQVIAPLFGKGFDGFELITLLAASGFRGRLSLMGGALPNRGMVLRELRALAEPEGIEVHMPPGRTESAPRVTRLASQPVNG
jgi:hypothetical protein